MRIQGSTCRASGTDAISFVLATDSAILPLPRLVRVFPHPSYQFRRHNYAQIVLMPWHVHVRRKRSKVSRIEEWYRVRLPKIMNIKPLPLKGLHGEHFNDIYSLNSIFGFRHPTPPAAGFRAMVLCAAPFK